MIKIVADTLACLPENVIKKYNIPIISQNINFGNNSFRENIDLFIDEFYEKLNASSEIPTTAAPYPADYIKLFEKLLPLHETILIISPTAKMSGTFASASLARKEFPSADIRIIDTNLIASSLGTVVEQACIWAEQGLSADEIEEKALELSSRNKTYFYVDTLEYLARGGRIGGAKALMGSMLQVKPILCIENGQIDQYESIRTRKKAIQRFKDIIHEQCPKKNESLITLMHADVEEEALLIKKELEKEFNIEDIYLTNVPPAVVTHAGPGVFAVGFFTD